MKRVAIVTGASKGIGEATAEMLARKGYITYFVSRAGNPSKCQLLTKEGFEAHSLQYDLSDEKNVQKLVKDIEAKHGQIDALVNCAGIVTKGKIEDISLDSWKNVMGSNVTSAFLLCKYIVPLMKQKKYGKIVNVSSIAGRSKSMLSGIDYVTSKAALIGFTRQLSYEVAPFNINVNCVAPAQTDTEMLWSVLPKEKRADFEKNIPIGRIATPADVAHVIVFLLSEEARHVAGAIIDVNGGQY